MKSSSSSWEKKHLKMLKILPDGELNPGLLRDRQGYSPLYYRGLIYLKKFSYELLILIEKFEIYYVLMWCV